MSAPAFFQAHETDLLDELFDGVYILDTERQIIFWNQGAERITGYPRSRMLGIHCNTGPLRHEDAQGCRLCHALCPAERAMRERKPVLDSIFLHHADGRLVPIETHVRPLADETGQVTGAIEVFRDISDWKKIEGLSQEKDHLMGVLAHDIRNPLAVIQTYAVFIDRTAADPKIKEMVAPILRKVKMASSLVDSLLDSKSIENGTIALNIEEVFLETVLRESISNYEGPAKEKEIKLTLRISEPSLTVFSDPLRLEEIFNNLISNAIHYSQRGAEVVVLARPYVDGLEVQVSDHGVGISQEDQAKLFKPYGQASSRPTGGEASHGLGLYIVKRLMDLFAGEIAVESIPDQGTTFRLRFPHKGCPLPGKR